MEESSSPKPTSCPACGADSMSQWDSLDSWVCDQCSYVISEKKDSPPGDLVENLEDESENPDTNSPWDEQVAIKDKSEANLVDLLSIVEDLAEQAGIPDEITEHAAEIATDSWTETFLHGRCKYDTAAAAVYAASRASGRSVPPGQLCDGHEGLEKRSVKATYKALKSTLDLDLTPPTPVEYLHHIISELDLPTDVAESAQEALENQQPHGGNPVGIAAAAVYLEGPQELTYRDLGTAADLTKETIWNHASELRSG